MNKAFSTLRLLAVIPVFLVSVTASTSLFAAQVTVAVASEFDFTLEALKQAFEESTPHTIKVVHGPSARQYGQILNGAPVDIYLADDESRPLALESAGKALPGSRFTYARSRLALWSISNRALGAEVLRNGEFHTLAITNPRLSRYGQAQQEALQSMSVWDSVQDKLVLGNNPGDTYQLAISGDVEISMITFDQLIFGRYLQAGSYWLVPPNYYPPLDLQGVQLTDNAAASEFMAFMQSELGQTIIRSNGFDTP